ncbi:MAG: TIGR04282 family arsenosugar biosynthesis glycosyltransferase [Candidatus Binataceae bacterium]
MRQSSRAEETIVVFAREPIAGLTKTRLIPRLGANGAAALASAFTLDTLAKAHATGREIVIAGDAPHGVAQSTYFRRIARMFDATLIDQGDGTLGARMRRSLAPFCASGAVLIGTDVPSLPAPILTHSLSLLRQHPVILAPSLDGGYYLVGVRGPLPDIFRGIRWGSARVLAETAGRLRRTRTDYALAAGWYDIDRRSDLLVLAAELRLTASARSHPCPATAGILAQLGLL